MYVQEIIGQQFEKEGKEEGVLTSCCLLSDRMNVCIILCKGVSCLLM